MPPVRPGTSAVVFIPVEMGAAIFGGIIVGFVFGYGCSLLFANANLGMGLLIVQAYAAIVGFGVGAGAGTALAGRTLGQSGSWWLAMLAAVLGGMLVVVVMRVAGRGDPILTLGVAIVLMVVFAVAGYNLRHGP